MKTSTTPAASNVPAVGTRASYSVGSDRYPCTVIAVSPSGHRITVREVRVTEWTAFPESRGAAFEDDGKGKEMVFTRRANGRYRHAGWKFGGISFGEWGAYQDPSF